MNSAAFNWQLGSLIFVVLSTVILSILVIYHNRRNVSNQLFALLSLSFSIWAVINYFSINPPEFGSVLFWIRLVLFSAAPQAVLFAFFMRTFPSQNITWSKKLLVAFIVLLVVQMAMALSPLVFKETSIINGEVVPVAGNGIPFYALALLIFFGYGIFWLVKKTFSSRGEERSAMMIIFVSFATMVIFLLSFLFFAVVIFQNTTFIPYSHLFVLPFVIGVSYALTKKKFLNIKLIATEFLVGLLTVSLLTEAFLSGSLLNIIWKTFFSFGVAFLGVLLIRSVQREIDQREELEKVNLRLQELDKQKTEFLSIASHQMRTPLSIAKGYLELISDGAYGKPPKELLPILDNMDQSNEHLIKLIDEFLDISRIEQGRTKFIFTEHDLVDLINQAVAELSLKAKDNGLSIKWRSPSRAIKIMIDEEKIRHVVYNFVDNAIKYTPSGEVAVSLKQEDGGYTVRVTDTGIGFGKVDEANFFQKFYRGNNVKASNVTGTGLGLFVCLKFIEAHGGRVWAHSRGLGKGSEFGFWIPEKR